MSRGAVRSIAVRAAIRSARDVSSNGTAAGRVARDRAGRARAGLAAGGGRAAARGRRVPPRVAAVCAAPHAGTNQGGRHASRSRAHRRRTSRAGGRMYHRPRDAVSEPAVATRANLHAACVHAARRSAAVLAEQCDDPGRPHPRRLPVRLDSLRLAGIARARRHRYPPRRKRQRGQRERTADEWRGHGAAGHGARHGEGRRIGPAGRPMVGGCVHAGCCGACCDCGTRLPDLAALPRRQGGGDGLRRVRGADAVGRAAGASRCSSRPCGPPASSRSAAWWPSLALGPIAMGWTRRRASWPRLPAPRS